jgi:mRNA interferase RelE/StbE
MDTLDDNTVASIYKALRSITKNPPIGDVKKLKDKKGYRLRVGDYRILFDRIGNHLIVDEITTRGQAYK